MRTLWPKIVKVIYGLGLVSLRKTLLTCGIFAVVGHASFAGDLDGPNILKVLKGNSISSPLFGCSYYRDEKSGVTYTIDGSILEFQWSVRGDLYVSDGKCGTQGCKVENSSIGVRFTQPSSGYDIKVLLLPGNQCDREQQLT